MCRHTLELTFSFLVEAVQRNPLILYTLQNSALLKWGLLLPSRGSFNCMLILNYVLAFCVVLFFTVILLCMVDKACFLRCQTLWYWGVLYLRHFLWQLKNKNDVIFTTSSSKNVLVRIWAVCVIDSAELPVIRVSGGTGSEFKKIGCILWMISR